MNIWFWLKVIQNLLYLFLPNKLAKALRFIVYVIKTIRLALCLAL